MKVGDLVILKDYADKSDISLFGMGIVLVRTWNNDGFWESLVWFEGIDQHVMCDDVDLKHIA
tara:strand:- start:208 stop:393 length:186 start_codon:yes stop_codon:yes gene_type:complete